jgi:hypothetical protein
MLQQVPSAIRSGAARRILCALLALAGLQLSATASVSAQETTAGFSNTPFRVNDEDPEQSLPTPEEAAKRPMEMGYLMMELSDRAELARKRGEHAKAAKYYRAMAKAVPDRAVAFSKACEAHEAAGQWSEALEMCRGALGRPGVKAEDQARFVRVTLHKPAIETGDMQDIEAVIAELRAKAMTPEGKQIATELECELAVRLEDVARTNACVAGLKELGRSPTKVKFYEWALALMQNDDAAARDILAKAKLVGVPPEALASMQLALDARASKAATSTALPAEPKRSALSSGWPLGWPLGIVGAIAIATMITVLRRRARADHGL